MQQYVVSLIFPYLWPQYYSCSFLSFNVWYYFVVSCTSIILIFCCSYISLFIPRNAQTYFLQYFAMTSSLPLFLFLTCFEMFFLEPMVYVEQPFYFPRQGISTSQGRGDVLLRSTLPKPHLWDSLDMLLLLRRWSAFSVLRRQIYNYLKETLWNYEFLSL